MSLGKCIPDLIADGELKGKAAEAAEASYRRHLGRFEGQMSPAAAAAEASKAALGELEYQAALKKRRTLLTIDAQRRQDEAMDALLAEQPTISPFAPVQDMIIRVDRATQRIEFDAHARLVDFIDRHRRTLSGKPGDKAGLDDVIDALHGDPVKNERAKVFAASIGDLFEAQRKRANKAGMSIGRREDFGVPHRHDPLKVRRVPFEQWRKDLLDGIDPERMIDPQSGGSFTPDRLEEFIAASHRAIRTDGMSMPGAGGGSGGKSAMLADRHSDHRHFVFKSGAAWRAYDAKYGKGNGFEAILDHVRSVGRDTAMIEEMGPNPHATFDRSIQRASAIDAARPGRSSAVEGTSFGKHHAEQMWRYSNGELSVPVIADGALTGRIHGAVVKGLAGTRELLTGAMLGGSPLSAISDANTQIFARQMNALPAMRTFKSYLEQMNPFDATHRKRAIRLGLGMRDATRTMMSVHRFFGDSNGPAFTQLIADDVLRLSGINKLTEAGQRGFGYDYLGELAEERHLDWAELPDARRRAFARNSITPEEWNVMRRAPVLAEDGGEWMDYRAIDDPQVADKLMDMILGETSIAVQEADLSTRTLIGGSRPGTIQGEIIRNSLQFKSFSFGLMMNQAKRISTISRELGPAAAASYAFKFAIGMTMFGVVTIQLRELAKGRDMRDWSDPELYADGLVQGGGLGIIGDLIGTFSDDRIKSIAGFFGGPMLGLADDTKGLIQAATDDTDGNGGRQAARFARRYFPGTSLWWGRAVGDHIFFDHLQAEIDPDYASEWARGDAQRMAEQGQGNWWEHGELLPSRLPQVSKKPEEVTQ